MLVLYLCVFSCIAASTAVDVGSCSSTSGYARADASDRVGPTVVVQTVAQCCDACTADYHCQSWTTWVEKNVTQCNLFSKAGGALNKIADGHYGSPGDRPKRPNMIFVFPDTLRAEAFSSYGNPLNVTPHLDAFAKTATRFEQAHVAHTQCSPSRCTMMTGRYMHVMGHRTQTHLVQSYETNYFQLLKDSGYHVLMLGKNDNFSPDALNRSISEWHPMIGYSSGSNAVEFGEAGYYSFLSTGSNNSGADPTKSADLNSHLQALEFMNNNPPEPFAIFLTTRGAHPPYGAPLEWHNKFSVEDVKENIDLRPPNIPGKPVFTSYDNGIPHFRNLTTLDDDFFRKIQAVYLGMVSYTDWIFGQLLEGLAKTQLENNTAVFFSSDHGDFGGDYHLVEKWPGSMDDVLTRVPLFARIPGGVAGHVVKAPVQTADILETMLDLAHVNASDWVRFGKSFKKQVANGQEGDMARFVYSEGGFYFPNEQQNEANECLSPGPKGLYYPRGLEESQPNGSPRAVMIRNLTAKLVARPTGVSELYDLEKDPRELKNVYLDPEYAVLRAEMSERLTNWLILTSDVTPEVQDQRGFAKFPHPVDTNCLPHNDQFSADVLDYLAINGINDE